MKKLNLFLLLMLIITGVIAQSKYKFNNIKQLDGNNIVYFSIDNLKSENDIKNISIAFSSDNNIVESEVRPNGVCRLIMHENIDADYIYKIFNQFGFEYEKSSVTINERYISENDIALKRTTLQKNRTDGMPEHYPVYINTENADVDNSRFENDKQEWLRNYPQEAEMLYGRSIEDLTGIKKIESGKPQYIDTGNPEKDRQVFENAKKEWYSKRPELK